MNDYQALRQNQLGMSGRMTKKQLLTVDAEAAQLILESWFNRE